jgi:hypothetical protein
VTQAQTERRPVSRRTWWLVGIVGVLAMSAVAVWFGLSATSGRVHWVNTGHSIGTDTEALVRFDLIREPDRSVTCQLLALDERHAPVGSTEVEVGAADSSPSRHVEPVRTVTRAVTAYVERCWYTDEGAPPARG